MTDTREALRLSLQDFGIQTNSQTVCMILVNTVHHYELGLTDSAFSTITIVAEAIVIIFDSFMIVCLPIMDLLIPSVDSLMQKHYGKLIAHKMDGSFQHQCSCVQ